MSGKTRNDFAGRDGFRDAASPGDYRVIADLDVTADSRLATNGDPVADACASGNAGATGYRTVFSDLHIMTHFFWVSQR